MVSCPGQLNGSGKLWVLIHSRNSSEFLFSAQEVQDYP